MHIYRNYTKITKWLFTVITISLQSYKFCVQIHVCFSFVRFMLKRTKPGLVSSNSSARLLEDVVVDKDNYDHLPQSSRVRLLFSPCLVIPDNQRKYQKSMLVLLFLNFLTMSITEMTICISTLFFLRAH